jgi:glycosidase
MMAIAWNGDNAAAMTAFYTSLLGLRTANSALQGGSLTWVSSSGGDRVLSFTRTDATGTFLIVVNVANATVSGTLSNLPSASGWTDVSPQGSLGGTGHVAPPSFSLQAHDFAVFRAH